MNRRQKLQMTKVFRNRSSQNMLSPNCNLFSFPRKLSNYLCFFTHKQKLLQILDSNLKAPLVFTNRAFASILRRAVVLSFPQNSLHMGHQT